MARAERKSGGGGVSSVPGRDGRRGRVGELTATGASGDRCLDSAEDWESLLDWRRSLLPT